MFRKRLDTIALDGGEKFFIGFAVGGEGIFPDGGVAFFVDHLEGPVEIGTRRARDADMDDDIVVGKLAGQFRKLEVFFCLGHKRL
ncbi:hypothetical protein FQZ97_1231210 [compost metagenome]